MNLESKRVSDAVSPVVGVILMVAVTVILAAVIGTFVLDLGNNVQANPQAGVNFAQDASNDQVSVQVISMENADRVDLSDSNSNDWSDDGSLTSVGEEESFTSSSEDASGTVTAVGVLDGKETVLQTYDYDL